MVGYRRARVPGGTYFFTVTLADRRAETLITHVDALRTAFRLTRHEHPFDIDAVVVMPEHLHTIWTLPDGDDDYATRWQLIKSRFTRALALAGESFPIRADGKRALWQPRYWEHVIRNQDDLRRHVDYIHYNPVKHGHVSRVCDWRHSSFHAYVRRGWLPLDWGGDACADEYGFGERGG